MPELAHEMDAPLGKIHLYQYLSQNGLSLELPVDGHFNTEDMRTLGDRADELSSEGLRGGYKVRGGGISLSRTMAGHIRIAPTSNNSTAIIIYISNEYVTV